ncbi:PHP domain-containing protein [Candidatus Uhrbacteria bacterium]|nr:PHP domain-containing protein [Candidatus Uhrbacteria bacterium]
MIKGGFDLQAHSIFSDGEYTPLQIMRMAKNKGLAGVVVTDHNAIAHFDAALRAASKFGLTTLEGLEITTNYDEINLHILGYAKTFKRAILAQGLKRTIDGYERRLSKMLDRLYAQEGIRITIAELRKFKPKGALVKFDIYRALVKRYPRRAREFKAMLTKQGSLVTPYDLTMLSPKQAIRLIHRAGGVAILSHPADKGRTAENKHFMKRIFDIIERLRNDGLDGLEVYSSHHTPAQIKALLAFVKRKGLLITGGSDFHGPTWHSEIKLGQASISSKDFHHLTQFIVTHGPT